MRALLLGLWLVAACAGGSGSSSSSHTAHLDEASGLDSSEIQRVIRAKHKVLEGCAIVSGASAGSLRIVFEIAPSGKVEHAEVSDSDVANPALESCLVRTFERMEFPQAKAATRSEYPFNLRAKGQ